MKNILLFFLLLGSFLSLFPLSMTGEDSIMSGDDKKDWVLDLKTSQLIPNYAGKVKKLKGKVFSQEDLLRVGDKIFPKNKIKTTENSFVIIEMIDRSYISLGPKSEMEIENWQFRNKNDREGTYFLFRGALRGLIREKSQKNDQIKFKTPLAALGVRGTEIFVNHYLNEKSKPLSEVGVLSGKLTVIPNQKALDKIDLNASDMIVIEEKDSLNLEGSKGQFKVRAIKSEERALLKTLQEIVDKNESPWFLTLLSDKSSIPSEKDSQELEGRSHESESKSASPVKKNDSWKDGLKELNELREKNSK